MLGYIVANFAAISITFGMIVLMLLYPAKEQKTRARIIEILIVNIVLSVAIYTDSYIANIEDAGPDLIEVRRIVDAVSYVLRILVPALFMALFFKDSQKKKALIITPLIVSVFIYGATIFKWNLAFGIKPNNSWFPGPLHFIGLLIGTLYLLMSLVIIFRDINHFHVRDAIMVLLLSVLLFGAVGMEYFSSDISLVYSTTVAVCCSFYLQYYYMIPTRIDPVTGIFNRHYYENDVERYAKRIRFAISVDMNGLKVINDTQGHEIGDKGLAAIGEALRRGTVERQMKGVSMKAYRTGGDEFIVFGFSDRKTEIDPMKLDQFIAYIKDLVITLGFSAACGYEIRQSMDMTVSDLIAKADEKMYIQKRKMKGSRD